MRRGEREQNPILAAAHGGDWRRWLAYIVTTGRRALAWFGLTLLLGFATGAMALYLFAEIAEEVVEEDADRLDNAVLTFLQRYSSSELDAVARFISMLGSEILVILLAVLLVVFAAVKRWGMAVSLLIVTGGAQLLNSLLKLLFERTRPETVEYFTPGQQFSFPSGHAMVSAAFYLFLAYLSWRMLHGWWRLLIAAGLLLLIFMIGLTRIYLGVHYLTDVIAGYIAGFIWVDTVVIGGHLLGRRRHGGTNRGH